MRLCKLQDVIYFSKEKSLPLKNEKDEEVGFISREDIPGYEKRHVFSYTSIDEQSKVIVGIKKSGPSRLIMAKYGVITKDQEYELKDKLGNNLLYFCVTGVLDNKKILMEENWDRDIEIKVEKQGCVNNFV